MKLFYQLFILPAFLCTFFGTVYSQTVIWSEDFTYPDNTTMGTAGRWVSACTTCVSGDYFHVLNNAMAARDVNDWAAWESESIDISSCSNVSFSLTVTENGDHDGPSCACGINIDYFDVYYSINGGAFQVIEDWNGDGEPGHTLTGDSRLGVFDDADWGTTTITQSGLTGTSLQLRIELRNTSGSEEMVFDDVSVICTPLPVEMTSLTANSVGETVEVVWETAMESGSDHFLVERSANGSSFFSIGRVAAAGNSTALLNYRFVDQQPIDGAAFYRLKQVDQDGSFSYTETVEVNANTAALQLTSLYPNPSVDQLHLDLHSRTHQEALLSVFDLMGNQVRSGNTELQVGKNTLDLSVSDLASGIYLLRIKAGAETLTQRFQVQ